MEIVPLPETSDMPTPRDPMDDFEMIDPGNEPSGDRGTDRPSLPSPDPGTSDGPSRPARRRPAPDFDPAPSRKWPLPVGIGAAVVLVGGIVAALVLTGTGSDRPSTSAVADPGSTGPSNAVASPSVRTPTAAPELSKGGRPNLKPVSAAPPLTYVGRPIEFFDYKGKSVTSEAVGGHGRFLFVCVEGGAGIQVIDLTTGLETRVIPFPAVKNKTARVVAGADVLVAVDTVTGVATSWPLPDFTPATTVDLGLDQIVRLTLGSGSNGPMIVNRISFDTFNTIHDPATLQRLRYDFDDDAARLEFAATGPRAFNSTGTLLAAKDLRGNDRPRFWKIGPGSFRLTATGVRLPDSDSLAVSGDGTTAAAIEGVWRLADGRKIAEGIRDPLGAVAWSVDPSDERLALASSGEQIEVWDPKQNAPSARFKYDPAAAAPFAKIDAIDRPLFPRRLFCVSRSNVVAVVFDKAVLVWHADPARMKPEEAAKNDPSFRTTPPLGFPLFPLAAPKSIPIPKVVPPPDDSPPKIAAKQGRSIGVTGARAYSYQVRVVPMPTYPLKYELKMAPEGMGIDDAGLVTWDPVAGPTSVSHEIVVRVYNEARKLELTDSWKLTVFGKLKK